MPLPFPNIKEEEVRRNFEAADDLLTDVNNTASALATLVAQIVPPGVVFSYAASAAPTGFLICDGTAVSRTTYTALFAIVGTTYGVGDGSTTFNLPDLRGRAAVGLGTHTDIDTLGENDGVAVASRTPKHVLTSTEMPAHTHSAAAPYTTAAGGTTSGTGIPPHNSTPSGGSWSITTGSTGGGTAHDHGFIALNFIIKT